MTTSSPITDAINKGDIIQVKAWLQDQPDRVWETRGPHGESLLLLALYHGQREIADLMLQSKPELDIHEAAATGNLAQVQHLVAAQPDLVNALSPDGFAPLGYACFFNQPEVAAFLIEKGADVNAPSQNAQQVRPIHSAAAARNSDLVALLLEKGADINAPQGGGFTALHAAAHHGDEPLIKLLLEHMADINAVTHDGKTAMELAIKNGHDAAKWFTL
jgi:ankyrin repeat protein